MKRMGHLPKAPRPIESSFIERALRCGERAFFGSEVSPRHHLQWENTGKFLRVFFEGLKPAIRARLCYNKIVREGLYREFEFAPHLKPLTRDPDQTENVKAATIYPWRPFVLVILPVRL